MLKLLCSNNGINGTLFGLKIAKVAGCVFEEVLSGWPKLTTAGRIGLPDTWNFPGTGGKPWEAIAYARKAGLGKEDASKHERLN